MAEAVLAIRPFSPENRVSSDAHKKRNSPQCGNGRAHTVLSTPGMSRRPENRETPTDRHKSKDAAFRQTPPADAHSNTSSSDNCRAGPQQRKHPAIDSDARTRDSVSDSRIRARSGRHSVGRQRVKQTHSAMCK
ncbi:predicted protein [Scheffersomyces stipitis CBS 6054]|uniref:Uncharacterized protein n=1 Tax=Scheffersomyces stipitis (strain ATCC 58785 / CBS 6054 / NBRC 10063 / NRRL Y-11545) TaxID=322104 RepID=A3LZS4_PICST|nr:predicted protein [Scheffersomyces stipitis CBS 6054]ABN68389.2 predicted protein [Scheffersomyces stipitis CBS 6054]